MVWRPFLILSMAVVLIGCAAPAQKSVKQRVLHASYAQTDTGLMRNQYAWSEDQWDRHQAANTYEEYVKIAETTDLRVASLDARTALKRHHIPSRITVVDRQMVQLYVPKSRRLDAMRLLERDAAFRNYWMIRP